MVAQVTHWWITHFPLVREHFEKEIPRDYPGLVKAIVELLQSVDGYARMDPQRIHQIDDGDDSDGTLLFVIGAAGYNPKCYWYIKIDRGSCFYRDSLIFDADSAGNAIDELITLSLHVVIGLSELE